MNRNIVLIGFMGAGKSTAGKMLAEKLEKRFVETDELVEKKVGKYIKKIFEEDGETQFRELEIEIIKEVAEMNNAVISCGGGVVMNTINVERLRKKGVIFLLNASPESILRRTSEDHKRPLLGSSNPLALLKNRMPFYRSAADFIIDTTELAVNEVVTAVMRRYHEYHCQRE